MRKLLIWVCGAILTLAIICAIVTVPGMRSAAQETEKKFTLDLIVDTEGIYSVFYTYYIEGKQAGMGGLADLDGHELEPGRVLEREFTPDLFDEDADLSKFSIVFSPYNDDSPYELGCTEQVVFPVEYGQTYRIHLVKLEDRFVAVPEWETEEAGEEAELNIEIGGDIDPAQEAFSYLHIDYFANGEQCGMKYTCPNEGEDVLLLPFLRSEFEGIIGVDELQEFRMDIYLSYSDYKGDEAVLQAMMGNTGRDEYLDSITINKPEPGNTYRYRIVQDSESGYKLEPAE